VACGIRVAGWWNPPRANRVVVVAETLSRSTGLNRSPPGKELGPIGVRSMVCDVQPSRSGLSADRPAGRLSVFRPQCSRSRHPSASADHVKEPIFLTCEVLNGAPRASAAFFVGPRCAV
jgi:hypothetical protein